MPNRDRLKKNATQAAYYRRNPEVAKAYGKAWYQRNAKLVNAKRRAWEKAHPEISKARSRKKSWRAQGINITHKEYDAMWAAQGGCCKICGIHASELSRALEVDHDHVSGAIRGLLCRSCNAVLGFLKDDPTLLRKALLYLGEEG